MGPPRARRVLAGVRPAYRLVLWAGSPATAPAVGLAGLLTLAVLGIVTEATVVLVLAGVVAVVTLVAGLMAGPAMVYLHTIRQLQRAGIGTDEIRTMIVTARQAARSGTQRTVFGLPRQPSEVFAEHATERLRAR